MNSGNTFRASVSSQWLAKADRLFRNDDAGVWAELLQNSRRAGATTVEVTIEEVPGPTPRCLIGVLDNGCGIDDFATLLRLGDSDWNQNIQAAEDPAGMGFFCLCRSQVEVQSRNRFVKLTPESFQGIREVEVQTCETFVQGTRVWFTRASSKSALTHALQCVTEFCPLEVRLDGEMLPRYDFLSGALHREVVDGIEIGLGTKFTWGMHHNDENWNFYGVRIRDHVQSFEGFIDYTELDLPKKLALRFNVLDTGKVKLQLPDRHAIIEDGSLEDFLKRARKVVYQLFQRQEQHLMPFQQWQEAKELGVILPEAGRRLRPWHAAPQDGYLEPLFGDPEPEFLKDLEGVVVVSPELPNAHTLDAALHTGTTLQSRLYCEANGFAGYSWYDSLPQIVDTRIFVDEIPYRDWPSTTRARPSKIEIEITIERAGTEERKLRLPALIHVDSDSYSYEPEFVGVLNSPWDNENLDGPFSVADFLMTAIFSHSDDGDSDSWETQREACEREVQRAVNAYFRGPEASLRAILSECLDFEAKKLAEEIGVTEIRLKKAGSTGLDWSVELIRSSEASQ